MDHEAKFGSWKSRFSGSCGITVTVNKTNPRRSTTGCRPSALARRPTRGPWRAAKNFCWWPASNSVGNSSTAVPHARASPRFIEAVTQRPLNSDDVSPDAIPNRGHCGPAVAWTACDDNSGLLIGPPGQLPRGKDRRKRRVRRPGYCAWGRFRDFAEPERGVATPCLKANRRARPWLCRSGAPRPMKMGNIVSLSRYDALAYDTPEPENTRPPAILCCAQGAGFPLS